ncbi:dehydratase [Lithospermum erythrorhizon]|uniref:Dehydratase n=1 Tax=Lithospermum erythrorhizon TaxID=34254 RepID=A0AAV3RHK2_LITER
MSDLCNVCVTGGASYIGSSLVKTLLDKGYGVHATLRKLDNEEQVGVLKSFPGAETRLKLFAADLFEPEKFEQAIEGCQFVFHVVHPMAYSGPHQIKKSRFDAAIDAARTIADACMKSGTVKKLIYSASVVAASPMKSDGSGYQDFIDESCWTPLDLSVPCSNDYLQEYTDSKTLVEKELSRLGKDINGNGLDVVSLVCGLVGGETYLPHTPMSVLALLSFLTGNEGAYNSMKYLEELLGKVPVVHIDDVCEAHVFCIEQQVMPGRVLCASDYVSVAEMAEYYQQKYPESHINPEYLKGPKREIKWGSTKLMDKGFQYRYDWKEILDGSVSCTRKIGDHQI